MKVILTERVKTLGNVGEVVNVSQGYARNFLIPNRFAVLADESNKKQINNHHKRLAKKVDAEKSLALETKKKIEGLVLEMTKKVGSSGKLFGTVTNADLCKELSSNGIEVERRLISLPTPIKMIGTFDANCKLFEGVSATFQVKVIVDPKQAQEMKAKEEAAERAKEAKAAKAAADAEAGEGEEKEPEVPKTEEQLLQEEANKILRSF